MSSVRVRAVPAVIVFLLAAGCASDRDAIDRRLAGLAEDIDRLQATNDRLMQRVDALEVERTAPVEKSSAPKSATTVEHVPLKVVKLEPEGGVPPSATAPAEVAAAERPDAPGDRPVIRLRGRGEERPPTASVRVVDEASAAPGERP